MGESDRYERDEKGFSGSLVFTHLSTFIMCFVDIVLELLLDSVRQNFHEPILGYSQTKLCSTPTYACSLCAPYNDAH
jgi:hypothetical protein